MEDPPSSFRVLKKRAPAEKPVSQSTWFFTISSNRKEEDLDDSEKAWFQGLIERLFARPYVLLRTAPRCEDYVSTEFYHVKPDLIKKIEVEVALETGPKRGIWHAHGRFHVIHTSRVHLQLAAIQAILREEAAKHDPEGPGIFFRATWTRGAEEARITNYLQKGDAEILTFGR